MDSWPPATTICGVAVHERLIAERDRAKAGAANLIHAPGRDLVRDARSDRSLARGVLALRRRQNLSQNDFGNLLRLRRPRGKARPSIATLPSTCAGSDESVPLNEPTVCARHQQ